MLPVEPAGVSPLLPIPDRRRLLLTGNEVGVSNCGRVRFEVEVAALVLSQ